MTDHEQPAAGVELKPKFGDMVENGCASEENPTRRGFFVREFRRTGRLNPGLTWEITDGTGKFWEFKPYEVAEEGRLSVTLSRAPTDAGGAVSEAHERNLSASNADLLEQALSHPPLSAPQPLQQGGEVTPAAVTRVRGYVEQADEFGQGAVLVASSDLRALLSLAADRDKAVKDAERYRFLRSRDPGPDGELPPAGPFIGQVPENLILTEDDADAAIDAFLSSQTEGR